MPAVAANGATSTGTATAVSDRQMANGPSRVCALTAACDRLTASDAAVVATAICRSTVQTVGSVDHVQPLLRHP
jgi:hypothetical protein